MRKIGLLLLVCCTLSVSSIPAISMGAERSDDIPPTSVFNNKREWNPRRIDWKGQMWECAYYNADGTCAKVQIADEEELRKDREEFEKRREAYQKKEREEEEAYRKRFSRDEPAAKVEPIATVTPVARDEDDSVKNDDTPCTCVFNNKRAWNPDKITWKGEPWECAQWNSNGTCAKVQKIEANGDEVFE